MKKILVTGCNGLLGANLVYHAVERFQVIASNRINPVSVKKDVERICIDVTDAYSVGTAVKCICPDIVIHCAAETRVDYCEDFPEHAEKVNVSGTQNLANAAESMGSMVVYISSDSAFDGQRGEYKEGDVPNPINVYSKTKVQGERIIQQVCSRYLIVRTNMFGWNMKPKESLAEWILSSLRGGETIDGFQDVLFAPLIVNDLSEILLDMCECGLQGIYHVCTHDHVSKFDFALRIARLFGYDERLIKSSELASALFKAPRPRNTHLDVAAVEEDLGRSMPSIDEELHRFRHLEYSGYVAELKSAWDD